MFEKENNKSSEVGAPPAVEQFRQQPQVILIEIDEVQGASGKQLNWKSNIMKSATSTFCLLSPERDSSSTETNLPINEEEHRENIAVTAHLRSLWSDDHLNKGHPRSIKPELEL